MRASRVDWVPIAAIAFGGTVGPLLIAGVLEGLDGDHVVRHEVVHVRAVRPEAEWRAAERPAVANEIRLHSSASLSPETDPKPIVYVDGIRLERTASIDEIDPQTIDRIEVVKPPRSVELYGEAAGGGVIQIFLKGEVSATRPDEGASSSSGGLDLHSSADPKPLFYLDGFRVEEDEVQDLEPGMIERVEVIKGTAAIEAYGQEGAAGVVLILLKPEAKARREGR